MAKTIILFRHTDNDDDVLTGDGITEALRVGADLDVAVVDHPPDRRDGLDGPAPHHALRRRRRRTGRPPKRLRPRTT